MERRTFCNKFCENRWSGLVDMAFSEAPAGGGGGGGACSLAP